MQFIMRIVALVAVCASLTGCPSGMNAVAKAETLQQKAYAGYGTATIFAERGAALIQDPSLEDNIKRPIALAITDAKPVADSAVDTLLSVAVIKAEIAAGGSKQEDLIIALTNLNRYYLELQPLVNKLVTAVTVAIRCGKLSGEPRAKCVAGGGA